MKFLLERSFRVHLEDKFHKPLPEVSEFFWPINLYMLFASEVFQFFGRIIFDDKSFNVVNFFTGKKTKTDVLEVRRLNLGGGGERQNSW